jgi:hypothetical protein
MGIYMEKVPKSHIFRSVTPPKANPTEHSRMIGVADLTYDI